MVLLVMLCAASGGWAREVFMQLKGHAGKSESGLGVTSWHGVVACRCSLQPSMRCSTTERTAHRGTTRLCC